MRISFTKYEKFEIAAAETQMIARALLVFKPPNISVFPVTIHRPTVEIPITVALEIVNPTI